MEIIDKCVVALTWTLNDTSGGELDVLAEPVDFLVGGHDLLAPIEAALQGHSAGAKLDLHIEPEEAFGDYNEKLLFLEPRDRFPAELEEGMSIEGTALPEGTHADAPKDVLYTVTDIYPDHVVLDGNHPLAGMAIRLHLVVHAVRHPTSAEEESGTTGTSFFKLPASVAPHETKH